MKRWTGFSFAARTAAVLILAASASVTAQAQDPNAPAQDPNAPQTQPANPNGNGGGRANRTNRAGRNAFGGMMGGMMSRQFGMEGPVDPTRNYQMDLLERTDVRTAISFGNSQIEKLEKLKTDSQGEMMDKMRAVFQNNNGPNPQDMTQQERQQMMQDRMKQMQTTLQDFQGEMDKRVEAILRPAQATRIRQMDLQWRGPLALSDPKVGDQVELTPDQKAAIKPLLEDYQSVAGEASQKAMAASMQAMRTSGSGGFNPRAMADPTQRNAMQSKMKTAFKEAYLPLQRDVDKTRRVNEAKAVALLTPDQKAKWAEMTGPHFTFGAE